MSRDKGNAALVKPRPPTKEEVEELRGFIDEGTHGILDQEDVDMTLRGSCVAVFDEYKATGFPDANPQYTGKVMTVVWGGSPSLYGVYVWADCKMEKMRLDESLIVER